MSSPSAYSFNFSFSRSIPDINTFLNEFKERVLCNLAESIDDAYKSPFPSFANKKASVTDETWLQDNEERFFFLTPNEKLQKFYYLSELGFVFSMIYSPDGKYLIVGYSTGLIRRQVGERSCSRHNRTPNLVGLDIDVGDMDELNAILEPYANQIQTYYEQEYHPNNSWYPLFYEGQIKQDDKDWVKQNYETFLKGTANEILYNRWYHSDSGYITALEYAPNGSHIIAGHSSGLIQMHHGRTGAALYTLRSIQFPPKPIYALEYSHTEERVCYAACVDGAIYRIEIPFIPDFAVEDKKNYGIKANPGLDCLQMQYHAAPGPSSCYAPFITQRSPALALGISADSANMVVGYGDTSIKVYDMETQAAIRTYKVHKLRLQFIPKKLQRMHFGQVCAIKCHDDRPFVFASAAWDKTVRIWDTRCQVGCTMTFEGVNVCSNSIDLKRNFCIAGSWLPTEALTVWDIAAKKKLSIVRVQNRRPDVDGEYIYACRFWNSSKYNRKAKYGIIGGSGTNCVEIINLHNRYITCSYPAEGAVLAITSHEDHIAFGGTAPVFNIVSFHDPKHEEYPKEIDHVYQDSGDVVLHDFEDYESGASTEA